MEGIFNNADHLRFTHSIQHCTNYQEVKSLPIDRERLRGVSEGAQPPPMVPREWVLQIS